MNKRQLNTLLIGTAVLIFLSLMCVPYQEVRKNSNGQVTQAEFRGYGPLFSPPKAKREVGLLYSVKIDSGRLAIQSLLVVAVFLIFIIVWRNRT